jgi:hypothetical protein
MIIKGLTSVFATGLQRQGLRRREFFCWAAMLPPVPIKDRRRASGNRGKTHTRFPRRNPAPPAAENGREAVACESLCIAVPLWCNAKALLGDVVGGCPRSFHSPHTQDLRNSP